MTCYRDTILYICNINGNNVGFRGEAYPSVSASTNVHYSIKAATVHAL